MTARIALESGGRETIELELLPTPFEVRPELTRRSWGWTALKEAVGRALFSSTNVVQTDIERRYRHAVNDHVPTRGVVAEGKSLEMARNTRTGAIVGIFSNEVVLAFGAHSTVSERQAFLTANNLRIVRTVWAPVNVYVAEAVSGRRDALGTAQRSRELATRSDILRFASPNLVGEISGIAQVVLSPKNWQLTRDTGIDAAGAWETLGSLGSPEIVVAILDDGIDVDHEDLKACIDGTWGRDFYYADEARHLDPRPKAFDLSDPKNPLTNDLHGTPCASLLAASNASAPVPVYGVAPGCKVLPIRMRTGDKLVPVDKLIAAFMHAATHADVLSCSWFADDVHLPAMRFVLQTLGEGHSTFKRKLLGVPVFFGAGNKGTDNSVVMPANLGREFDSCLCVSATTSTRQLATYSSRGQEVWICAPGGPRRGDSTQGDALTTSDVIPLPQKSYGIFAGFKGGGQDPQDAMGKWTDQFYGTSAATPVAAGTAALMLSSFPDLSAQRLREILKETADQIDRLHGSYDPSGHSAKYGYGQLNARKAVIAALAEKAASEAIA